MAMPGIDGYRAAQQDALARQHADLQQATGGMGLLQAIQAQQAQQQIKGILSSDAPIEEKFKGLLSAGPLGIQTAHELAQVQEQQGKMAAAKRTQDFYSPGNLAKFTEGGAPAQAPVTPVDDNGNPNPGVPAQPGQLNFDKFLQAGAAQGVVNPEVYANHLATRQAARDKLAQDATLKREQIQAQKDIADQKSEDTRFSVEERNRARMDSMRFAAALRQPPQPHYITNEQGVFTVGPNNVAVPVTGADGRPISGKPGGGTASPKTVQQLGTALEKAGLPSMLPIVEKASQLTPELAAYITGPQSVLPDRAVPQEARDARQDVQKLFNIVLKDRSGAAVTNQEMDRLKKEFGTGLIKTPEQLIYAVGSAKKIIESHYHGIAASFGKDALEAYNTNLEAIGGKAFRPGSSGGGGGMPSVSDIDAELARRGGR